jgi:hypothetical protein
MHSDFKITDGAYGVLSSEDVGKCIAKLGNGNASEHTATESELIPNLKRYWRI